MKHRPPPTPAQQKPPQPASMATAQTFPFDVNFQTMFLKTLFTDREFSSQLAAFIEPVYFQNNVHQWLWGTSLQYRAVYGGLPSMGYLASLASQQPEPHGPIFAAVTGQVQHSVVTDEEAMRSLALEFLKMRTFEKHFVDVRDLYNSGQREAAYKRLRLALDALEAVSWQKVDRAWLAEGFADRHIDRQDVTVQTRIISTGIPGVDQVLEGGAYPGFLGIWLAPPKVGKTTLLTNLGATACRIQRKRVLHLPLEGGKDYILARYDSIFTNEAYSLVKRGDLSAEKYIKAKQEFDMLKRLVVVRSFSDEWDVNILHVDKEMQDLKRTYGWEPDLIILDYVDLLRGRKGPYKSETAEQTDSAKDAKALANRGYAVWTASQVQRPDKKDEVDAQKVLTSKQIADCYAKVRIADFVGSLNQTPEERKQNAMRLYCELYRDGAADVLLQVTSDFNKMTFSAPGGTNGPWAAPSQAAIGVKPLGYVAPIQTKNGV